MCFPFVCLYACTGFNTLHTIDLGTLAPVLTSLRSVVSLSGLSRSPCCTLRRFVFLAWHCNLTVSDVLSPDIVAHTDVMYVLAQLVSSTTS
jgi:hypothetical protein